MREIPILFSGPMVRAILDGRKTMTRRPVRSPYNVMHFGKSLANWGLSSAPEIWTGKDEFRRNAPWNWMEKKPPCVGDWIWELQCAVDDTMHVPLKCPYGNPGDRLWVRETMYTMRSGGEDILRYAADSGYRGALNESERMWIWALSPGKTIPSIHMPKWACRLWLTVTGVRSGRLQEITEEDAHAEGMVPVIRTKIHGWTSYILEFSLAWDAMYAKPGYQWQANPWVWVIEFKAAIKLAEGKE